MIDAPARAEAMFSQGYNCAQAVFACCAEASGVRREQAVRLAAAFGGGMCYLDQTCGAVLGALMALGLRAATPDPQGKLKTHAPAQEFARRFCQRHGSIRCTDLMGVNLSSPGALEQARARGLFKAICPKLVHDAVEILNQVQPEIISE